MSSYHLDHLQHLESEAIHVMREVAGEFERPALLFSGGKDSICLLRLAEKAFRPAEIPMPFLNIETGHEFPELIDFRDRRAKQLGAKLIVRTVDDAIARADTFPKLLAHNARVHGDRPALRHKDLGIWQTWTWAQVLDMVRAYALGLHRLGLNRGDAIAIVGANRPKIYCSVMAAQVLGAVVKQYHITAE